MKKMEKEIKTSFEVATKEQIAGEIDLFLKSLPEDESFYEMSIKAFVNRDGDARFHCVATTVQGVSFDDLKKSAMRNFQ